MTDNIKPEHYRTGEIDLYEAWYRTYPFNEYRAIMQAVAERYMRRDKNDRVEDLGKAIYTLERLREKEIEHAKKNTKTPKDAFVGLGKAFGGINFDEWLRNKEGSDNIYLLKDLYERGFNYLARDKDGELWVYDAQPIKLTKRWMWLTGGWGEKVGTDNFPEVKWSDEEPTKISKLLASYENGGENGNKEVE